MDDTEWIREIETMVRDKNRCQISGWHEKQFRQYIFPNAVAVMPTTPGRPEGPDAYGACGGFAEAAVIHTWKETGHKVQLYAGGKMPLSCTSSRSWLPWVHRSRPCTAGTCSSL